MNNKQLKTKPGQWYSVDQFIPARPGLYQAKVRGIHKIYWIWFNGEGFGAWAVSKDVAVRFDRSLNYTPGRLRFRGLVKVGHEH